jgi:hypothetical protein
MKRRQFITLAGLTAVGTAAFPSPSLPAKAGSHWQPDGAGLLARIGVLTPNIDPVPESEMWAMAPPGVSIHGSPVVGTVAHALLPNLHMWTTLRNGLYA